jgi:hypothetical protein
MSKTSAPISSRLSKARSELLIKILLILLAGFGAGALNAIAGGGSFLTFPALVFVGLPAVVANATSTVALFPGSFASAFSYRRGLARLDGISMRTMVIVSLIGGIIGAILLLATPERVFVALTPWLLLFATLMFTFGKQIGTALKKRVHFGFGALVISQIVIAIYGGYFGGGIGILMLAALSVFGMRDINAMNGLKTILAGCLNGMAVVIFVAAGKVSWREALICMVAGIVGGYCGAHFAQKLPGRVVRMFVIVVGVAMSAYFFVRTYAPGLF